MGRMVRPGLAGGQDDPCDFFGSVHVGPTAEGIRRGADRLHRGGSRGNGGKVSPPDPWSSGLLRSQGRILLALTDFTSVITSRESRMFCFTVPLILFDLLVKLFYNI